MKLSVFSVGDHYPTEERTLDQLYMQILCQIKLAEDIGLHAYYVAEHHFSSYGVICSPPAILTAAATSTKRIGLGTAVAVLPFRAPLVIAEEYAMVDQVSGGRLIFGVGSGYLQHEFCGFGVDPAEKRCRFDETLDAILLAWQGRRFSYAGSFVHVDDGCVGVVPAQNPHPPVLVGILRPEAAYHLGYRGRAIMISPFASCDSINDVREIAQEHRRGARDGGHETLDICLVLQAFLTSAVSPSIDAARKAFDRYGATRIFARRRTFDQLRAAGLVLAGDSKSISSELGCLAESGVTEVALMVDHGMLPASLAARTLTLLGEEVAPIVSGGAP